ncbi:predicted protein [Uncinocarpus reesii 1704]|uniref:Uncharacterized protein n=1 Tax=Uncinocarpus reesii (strain UAMH 1704) TaxID=336963 RepID=C4JY24_UNCRE|nr:uncharacterized protein UREG_07075 [Uncinocarpus reesii 1704]EEP82210.1 predicted protein [Uncinocarpus reesii 1704]
MTASHPVCGIRNMLHELILQNGIDRRALAVLFFKREAVRSTKGSRPVANVIFEKRFLQLAADRQIMILSPGGTSPDVPHLVLDSAAGFWIQPSCSECPTEDNSVRDPPWSALIFILAFGGSFDTIISLPWRKHSMLTQRDTNAVVARSSGY